MSETRVLIVDDDTDTSDFIKLRLRMDAPAMSISMVTSGAECLEYLKTGKVDCILSDYQMPGMNGMELLEKIRESGDDTPVIFITGQGNEDVARTAFKSGAFDYFTKDIGFAHFPRIINSIEQAVIQRRARHMRERAERELDLEKAKTKSILASISDGISIQDKELRVMYQNPAHVALVGEHTGEHCYSAYDNREEPCNKCPVLASLTDGETHRLQKSADIDGRIMHVELTASPLRDADGNIIASIEIARDVTERVKIENALLESKHFLSSVFASIQDGICVIDTEYNIIRVNPTIEKWYAHEMPLIGKKCYTTFHGLDDVCDVCPSSEVLATGRPSSGIVSRIGSGGDTVGHFELHAFPLVDEVTGKIKGAIEYIRDVTEQRQIQESAARSRRLFADIVDSIKFGMVIVDRNRRVRRANETALKMMGLVSEDEIVGRICHRNICPAEEGKCPILDLGLKVDLSEKVLITATGDSVPILKTVTPVAIDGEELLLETFVDITAMKEAEKKVADAQRFLQSVIDGAADPIMVIDRDYTVSLMNMAAMLLSSAKPGAENMKCYEMSHAMDSPCRSEEGHTCPLEMVLATGEPVTVLHEHVISSGDTRWIEITASPLKDESGEIVSVIETSRDITDRKVLERERMDLQAMVTHDLKGPLTAILGYSEILVEDKAVADSEGTADMVRAIHANGKRLYAMIESYLAFSRLEDGRVRLNLSPVDLAGLTREACAEYAELARARGITLEQEVPEKLPYMMLDKNYVQRAVCNLIENAINYTQSGGTVTVGAAHSKGADTDEVSVYVSDNGPGIEHSEQEKVFEKYYRSEKTAGLKGTGLGLAIVKLVAEAHDARVDLESELGAGSTFKLTFVKQDEPAG